MNKDIDCPYCGHYQEINHNDGYGYEEDTAHNQTCESCDKTFVYFTSISFNYDSQKADCLNGSDHEFEVSCTVPRRFSKMVCKHCDEKRLPNSKELEIITSGLEFEEIKKQIAILNN